MPSERATHMQSTPLDERPRGRGGAHDRHAEQRVSFAWVEREVDSWRLTNETEVGQRRLPKMMMLMMREKVNGHKGESWWGDGSRRRVY